MRRFSLGFFFVFLNLTFFCFAKDPFKKLLPERVKPKENYKREYTEEKIEALREVEIQGVFWDVSPPQAIINGEVYKEGDLLEEIGAEITRIEKNKVTIIYRGRVFILSPQKKEE